MALQGLTLRLVFTLACGTAYLLYGYDQGMKAPSLIRIPCSGFVIITDPISGFMSGVLLADDWLQQMDQPSSFMQGFATSVYTLGCLAGQSLAPPSPPSPF